MSWLLNTDSNNRLLFAQRLVLALVILPHGLQKTLGWFGGFGFGPTMDFFTGVAGLPAAVAFLVILIESAGALALALGLLSRAAALGISAVMAGAVLTTHLPHGFFMNWLGSQKGEGFEYHLLVLALALPIVLLGGGRHALDTTLLRRFSSARSARQLATA